MVQMEEGVKEMEKIVQKKKKVIETILLVTTTVLKSVCKTKVPWFPW